jgi:hypothetical protein
MTLRMSETACALKLMTVGMSKIPCAILLHAASVRVRAVAKTGAQDWSSAVLLSAK